MVSIKISGTWRLIKSIQSLSWLCKVPLSPHSSLRHAKDCKSQKLGYKQKQTQNQGLKNLMNMLSNAGHPLSRAGSVRGVLWLVDGQPHPPSLPVPLQSTLLHHLHRQVIKPILHCPIFAFQTYNLPRRRWQAVQLLLKTFKRGITGNGAGALLHLYLLT